MIVVAVASMVLVAACAWAWCTYARGAWRERRAVRTEAARGITRLEIMLQELAAEAGPPLAPRDGDTGRGDSSSNPQIS